MRPVSKRKEILKSLVTLSAPLGEIRKRLKELTCDSDEEYEITKADILAVLYKASGNQISEQDLITWAELIEGRDDISFCESEEDKLKRVIYEAANPTLFGNPKSNLSHWIAELSG
jgi:DNA topoisomerase IB